MIWWLSQPSRLTREKAGVSELGERAEWLSNVRWRLDGVAIAVDFTLEIPDRKIELTLKYPDYFPDAPPPITPASGERLSGHQWGAGGELCLEFRPDNWVRDITGAMMIESAYRLLSDEADDALPPVPSAHQFSVGQQVRSSFARLLLSKSAGQFFASMTAGAIVDLELAEHQFGEVFAAQPLKALLGGEEVWQEAPILSVGTTKPRGKAVRLSNGKVLPSKYTREAFAPLIAEAGLDDWFFETSHAETRHILLHNGISAKYFWIYFKDSPTSITYQTIETPDKSNRLPEEYFALSEKRVGIVGCGSLGSKVAVSLARSGMGSFLLIDPDLFFPDNVVRNELDLRAVGINKGKALKQKIEEVSSSVRVDVRSLLLGGQESSGSFASAMVSLGQCDLIVDATATADVFNVCAAIARTEKKPMFWGGIYEGGIGGLIVRARPDLDPPPTMARAQISNWYTARGVPWTSITGTRYDTQGEDGVPMIADDADVSVIAAHLVRLIVDSIVNSDASTFPCSAYCIGLKKIWIFDAPFDTWPISLTMEGSWGPDIEENAVERALALLSEMIPGEGK